MKKGRIYTVHYGNNIEVTKKLIHSILQFLCESLELVIVNNSTDIDIDTFGSDFITIINSNRNLGYFGGIQFGMEQIPINNMDYIIICNNDVQIINQDFFHILDNKLDIYDIIAPSIKTLNNIQQNPHRKRKPGKRRIIIYKLYFCSFLFAFFIGTVIRKKKRMVSNEKKDHEMLIFSPHGAFIILNLTYFTKGGIVDSGYFLYGEEDSIAAQADALGLKIGFVPKLQIKHFENVNTGKTYSKQKYNLQKSAYKYIKSKYNNVFSR